MNCQLLHSYRLRLIPGILLLLTLLSPPIAQSQTIVQFKTPLGAMDVELFDVDKPVTVANFLNYVTNGIYKDMFFHRWQPGFVIQGGGFAVARRGATNAAFTLFKNLGTITNEYAVGQKRSNVFGTIAMAKLGNDPNSASSEWFFNLGDNASNLDNQNGGFTVFGRVIAGTNVLQRFNKQDPQNGIFRIDLTSVTPAFAALPILSDNPTFKDLAFLDIVVVSRASAPVITSHPRSTQVIAGDPAEFAVSASGTETLLYQWSVNGLPILNATNAFLRLPQTAAAAAGRYTVRVLNALGSATSGEALLDVRLFEKIPVQPFPISLGAVNDRSIEISIPGMDRAIYTFETSADLRLWDLWLRVTNTSGILRVTDPRGSSSSSLFYRSQFTAFTE